MNRLILIALIGWLVMSSSAADAARRRIPADLPEAEKAIAGTVDPYGIPFSDSLRRWKGHFQARPDAPFAVGVTHDTVKIRPNKYWFRGRVLLPGAKAQGDTLWAAAGATQAFQIACLPRTGAKKATFTIAVKAPGAKPEVFREVFVKCPRAPYPRLAGERWPDALLPATTAEATGLDLAAFWVDVPIPANHPGGVLPVTVSVRGEVDGKKGTVTLTVPVRVVPGLDLRPKEAMILQAWFRPRWPVGRKPMALDQMRQTYALALAHHLQPGNALDSLTKPKDRAEFDRMYAFLKKRGQRFFQLGNRRMTPELYNLLIQRGVIDTFACYGIDEPSHEILVEKCVPLYREFKKKYPRMRLYMASEPWPEVKDACDFFMTDLSSHLYDPRTYRLRKRPRLWHYYCHLPIRWQARAPLPQAPNMEIDNPAVEHRIAMWMSHHWGAEGVFIWSGNAWDAAKDLWTTGELVGKPYGFPYGGVHNGNGFLVIHDAKCETVLPTIRLKVLRAGMEDIALLEVAKKRLGRSRLVNPVPALFTHPHYFDRLPESLLARREAVLKALAGEGGK